MLSGYKPLPWYGAAPLAALSGSLAVLAFAPFGLYPLAVLALALWYQLLEQRDARGAFAIGWAFGLGLLGFGIFWIRISLNEFGNLAASLANALTLLFIAAMAFYYGLAGWAIHRLRPRARARGSAWVGPVLVLPAVWVLLEWLRGWLFTGFPWMILGNTQIDSPLAGLGPVLGVHGMSLAVALSAGLLWGLFRWRGRGRLVALSGLLALWLLSLGMGQVEWTHEDGDPLTASVVQANIAQSMKWDAAALMPALEAHLGLTREVLDSDVILWPETAVSEFLHEVKTPLIEPLGETARARGTEIVIGIPIMEGRSRYFNGLISIGSAEDVYYKRHLVPFGEYLPWKSRLGPLVDWFDVPMSDFSPGEAARPLMQIGSRLAGASICYEDVFPEEVRQALPEASYLINVSNDAWFGDSLAPPQHLQFARVRALENGRAMIRATNTGISAIIDHRGRLLGTLPLFERGVLTATVQPRTGSTPFSRWGSAVVLAVAVLMLVAALLLRRRRV